MKTVSREKIGGSIFVHNALEFDYCITESIASLCAVCDKVVVLDASSTDGTTAYLQGIVPRFRNLQLVTGKKWECASNYSRLAILANEAKKYLNTKWHFMLQADEVIHESSFPYIREAMRDRKHDAFQVRRYNLFGDMNHYIRFDAPADRKICSDVVLRLAHRVYDAGGDAESIVSNGKDTSTDYIDRIKIFHYGNVRSDVKFIEKIISMQSWFNGEGSQPDQRAVDLKNEGATHFDWKRFKTHEDLAKLDIAHPKFSAKWAEERQKEKIPVGD